MEREELKNVHPNTWMFGLFICLNRILGAH